MRVRAFFVLLLLTGQALADDDVLVAVASNFAVTAAELAARFEEESHSTVRLSSGSTGKLYAQIVNGAPFDVYLAADAARPAILERSGRAVNGTRHTYAVGRLVVYSVVASDCVAALQDQAAGHVAIANPVTAPYGAAAKQYLQRAGLWESVSARAVYGENIAQTLQFASTGNAVVALVGRAQLHSQRVPEARCVLEVPAASHDALEQQAVLLDADNAGAVAFAAFLRSETAREIIRRHGYEVPR